MYFKMILNNKLSKVLGHQKMFVFCHCVYQKHLSQCFWHMQFDQQSLFPGNNSYFARSLAFGQFMLLFEYFFAFVHFFLSVVSKPYLSHTNLNYYIRFLPYHPYHQYVDDSINRWSWSGCWFERFVHGKAVSCIIDVL